MQFRRRNPLLPILACAMLAVFVLVTQRACEDEVTAPLFLDAVPTPNTPDADTPADTITTLTANVAAMTRELERLKDDNASLKDDNEALVHQREALEEQVSDRLSAELARIKENSAREEATERQRLNARIDAITEALASSQSGHDELPVGFGFDDYYTEAEIVWIEPLDRIDSALSGLGGGHSAFNEAGNSQDALIQPFVTVPRNATLLGSRAMTALLGRVPIRGEVRDPMPFKVLTGRENLAANGYSIPGLTGMVWSGTAIGDWTLSCVSGELHSVTFVFADGSIKTLSSDEPGSEASGGTRRPLGWVSDERGVPCVSGERKSNAAQYLGQRIGASTIEAAANAAAAAQTETVIQDSGAVRSAVDGDVGTYVLGRTLADGGTEIARWLAERQAQEFDAVFVAAGADLVIHVDRELKLDLDPNARRLHYAAPDPADTVSGLD